MAEGNGNGDDPGEEHGPPTARSSSTSPPEETLEARLATIDAFVSNIAAEQARSFRHQEGELRYLRESVDRLFRLRHEDAKTFRSFEKELRAVVLSNKQVFEEIGKMLSELGRLQTKDVEHDAKLRDVAEDTSKFGRAVLDSVSEKAAKFDSLAAHAVKSDVALNRALRRKFWFTVLAIVSAFVMALIGWLFGRGGAP